MSTGELLTQFRSEIPLPDKALARQVYARATNDRRRITTGRAVAIVLAAACLAGAGTAVAYTVTRSPSPPPPSGGQHGPAGGQTNTGPIGTSTDCGIETQTYPLPPAGFDPTKATQAELQEYGFPPRPRSTDPNFQTWLRAMAAYKTTDPAEPTCGGATHPPATRHRS
jgi:hypothetical protein